MLRVGDSLAVVCGLFVAAASLTAERRLEVRGLSSCGTGAELPLGMWDLPRPGIQSVSLALQERFLTSGPPEKSPKISKLLLYRVYLTVSLVPVNLWKSLSLFSRIFTLFRYLVQRLAGCLMFSHDWTCAMGFPGAGRRGVESHGGWVPFCCFIPRVHVITDRTYFWWC